MSSQWKLNTGMGFSYNKDRIDFRTASPVSEFTSFYPRLTNYTSQARAVFTRLFEGLSKWHTGFEYLHIVDKIEAKDSIAAVTRPDNFVSVFTEGDIYLTPWLLAKPGVRYEYSSLLNKGNIAPRLSFAWKLNRAGQISIAYGTYFQKPETIYLLRSPELNYTKATHYILNYERSPMAEPSAENCFTRNTKT